MFLKSILACSMAAVAMVFADQITIDSPAAGSSFSKNTTIDIKYSVNNGGMTLMYSATAELVNDDTHEPFESFPSVEWSVEHQDAQASWTIPDDLLAGEYSIFIHGKATRQGKQTTVTQTRSFSITD